MLQAGDKIRDLFKVLKNKKIDRPDPSWMNILDSLDPLTSDDPHTQLFGTDYEDDEETSGDSDVN